MLSTMLVLIILSLIIIIHEAGHYIACRFLNTEVDEFSIFIGPKIITLFYYKETEFTLRWIPIGGFIKIKNPDKGKPLERIIVSSAGPFANWFIGFLVIMLLGIFSNNGLIDSILFPLDVFIKVLNTFIPSLGDIANNIQGPIGIAVTAGEFTKQGIVQTLAFFSVLNYSICLINLIPIPILDGFQILLSIVELITRKKANEKVLFVMHLIGASAVFTLILFSFYNDIVSLF
jgi:regulator of sigma E protease